MTFPILLLAALGLACAKSPAQELQAALVAAYGDTTRAEVLLGAGGDSLQVFLDSPRFDNLPDSMVLDQAREVRQLALGTYPGADSISTVTIRFVRFVRGAGRSWCHGKTVVLRQVDPTHGDSVVVDRLDITRAPCVLGELERP